MICNLCSVQGHKAVDCSNKNKCRLCWETGHFAHSCPNPWGRTATTENVASEDFPDLSPTARSVDDPPPAPNSVDVILDGMCHSLGSDISNLSDDSLETIVSGAETIIEDVTGSESILNTAAVDDYVADDFKLFLEASGPGAEDNSNTLEDVIFHALNNIGENDVVVVTVDERNAPAASLDFEDLVAATSTPEGGALSSKEDFTFDDNLSEVSTYSLTGQVSDDASSVCSTNDAQILSSSEEDDNLSAYQSLELAGKVRSFLSLSKARDRAHPVGARPRRSRRAKQT